MDVTLRQKLGPDAERLHELVDQLLDREDGIIVLVDGQRAVNYARGFALSGCQLELLSHDLERAVRAVTQAHLPKNRRHQHEAKNDVETAARCVAGDSRRGNRGRVGDEGCERGRPGDRAGGGGGCGAGRVLRMASQLAATDPG